MDGRSATVTVPPDAPVLDGAQKVRPDLPFACKGGVCGTCRALVTHGEVRMRRNFALEKGEVDAGLRADLPGAAGLRIPSQSTTTPEWHVEGRPVAEHRSSQWYAGTDRNAYIHRAWMRRGLPAHAFDGRPHIAIANTASDLTPLQLALQRGGRERQARVSTRPAGSR